jgi:hypothetical protein
MMTQSAAPAPEMPRGWRFRLGVTRFVPACGVHLVTIIAASLGASAATAATIAGANFAINKTLLAANHRGLGQVWRQLSDERRARRAQPLRACANSPTRDRVALVRFVIPICSAGCRRPWSA